jgi:hypothetical protein
MKTGISVLVNALLLATAVEAEVRVSAQESNGLVWLKYECTAGEVMRAFALDVSIDRGQILGVSDFFVGPSSAAANGYGIFPAAFRDHITVSSGTSANWSVSGYDPLAAVADAPSDTLPGLGSSGVTLEFGALWDAAQPAAAPAASGTLCALTLSQDATLLGTHITVAANASRGGVVASPDGTLVTPTFVGTYVGPLAEISVEQAAGVDLTDGSANIEFGSVTLGSTPSALTFTLKNTGSTDLTGLALTTDGTDAGEFTVSALEAPSLAPNASTSFIVTFAPAAAGARTAALHLASNDADENPFDITLTGTGVPSALQSWRLAHFGSIDNSGEGADLNDYDQDSLVNLIEFAFGLDPKQDSSGLLPVPQTIDSQMVLGFSPPAGVSGIIYGAEWSQELQAGTWVSVPDTGTPPQHTFSVPIDTHTRLYMRLKVTNPSGNSATQNP